MTGTVPIVVIHRDKQGREYIYPVRSAEVLVGRASSPDVCIVSQFVSRRHALLKKRGDGWVFQDLDSTSGSYFQGTRIREIPLPFETWIHLGAPGGHAIKLEHHVDTAKELERLDPDTGTQILQTIHLDGSRYAMGETTSKRMDVLSTRRLGSLYDLSATLSGSRERLDVFGLVLDAVMDQLPGERAAILVKEPGMENAEAVVIRPAGDGAEAFQPSRVLTNLVMRDQVGMVSMDASSDERLVASETLAFQAVRSVLAAPITSVKRSWGVIYVDTLTVHTPYDSEMLEFLLAVGRQLGMSLETLYLLSEQERMVESLMEVLSASIDARDGLTAGHSLRVAHYARSLAERLGWSGEECKRLYWAGLVHDYGKIGVDDQILRKPGKLTDAEFDEIRKHPRLTHDILRRIHFPEGLEELPYIAATHHERLDGDGYPFGLVGKRFPDAGQIIGIADVFDALTQERHYRKPMPFSQVLRILDEGRGSRWRSDMVDEFIDLVSDELRDMVEAETQTGEGDGD